MSKVEKFDNSQCWAAFRETSTHIAGERKIHKTSTEHNLLVFSKERKQCITHKWNGIYKVINCNKIYDIKRLGKA